MAKASFLLAVLCGLASLSSSLADPSMYGTAPTAKYPAPATYPAPAKYEAPTTTTTKYEAPTTKYEAPTTKYETPTTTTTKYEVPTTTKYEAPAKYEAEKPKYEEKKEEYPMKMEYKKEEYPMKPEYKKEEYPAPMKMKYATKKYKRSIEDDTEEAKMEDSVKLPRRVVQTVRDAVIQDLMSMMDETAVNDDEEQEDEEDSDEDLGLMTPEMDSSMDDDVLDDNTDPLADPMMMARIRILIKKRMCLRSRKCGYGRRRPWMFRPMMKPGRFVRPMRRPTVRPVTKLPPRMKCFWKRVCY